MKGYLFDGNVPSRLRFSPKLPIILLSKVERNTSDSRIWDFARKHDLAIVSKDTDFSDRIITSSPPPRVVHLRFGNLRRNECHTLLARRWPQIEPLLSWSTSISTVWKALAKAIAQLTVTKTRLRASNRLLGMLIGCWRARRWCVCEEKNSSGSVCCWWWAAFMSIFLPIGSKNRPS
jgi:predicted nuclease of predicted toxin-antitoxin system